MTEHVSIKQKSGLEKAYQTLDCYMGFLFISAQNDNAAETTTIAERMQQWVDNLDDREKRVIVPEIGSTANEMAKIGATDMFITAAVGIIAYQAQNDVLLNNEPIARCNDDEDIYRQACKTGHLALTTLRDLGVAMKFQNKNEQENIVKSAIGDCLMVS